MVLCIESENEIPTTLLNPLQKIVPSIQQSIEDRVQSDYIKNKEEETMNSKEYLKENESSKEIVKYNLRERNFILNLYII